MSNVIVRVLAGLNTATCVTGEGEPILALHGWGANIKSLLPVAERLAPLGYQVHMLDLPGFGESQLPPEPWSVADYMQFVLAYLDDCGLDRVAVLGHSFGGRIALMLAAEHPERVSKMVLMDAAGLRTPLTLKQQTRNFITRMLRIGLNKLHLTKLRTRLQEGYNRRYASEDYLNAGALRDTFLKVIHEDLSSYAQRIQASTVLIWGDRDADTPLWQGRKLEQLIPDAGLIVFQGAGHFAYLERLNDTIRIIDHFLSGKS
jgi:pimeloyl-ACP methyl ester carboxylesterase